MEAHRSGTTSRAGATATVTAHGTGGAGARPDPETTPKAARRRFGADYKLRIVQAADTCDPGGISVLLRREGPYSSQLADWRRQEGQLAALRPKKRGRPGQDPAAVRIAQLEREVRRLTAELDRANLVIEVQGKVSRLLGVPLRSPE